MRAYLRACVVLLLLTAFAACGGKRVLVPPRLDLMPYGRVALVIFTVENAKGSLHEFATQRFAEEVLAAQSGLPDDDLYETLNMGVGMIVVVPEEQLAAVLADPGVQGIGGFACGEVVSGDGGVRLVRSA